MKKRSKKGRKGRAWPRLLTKAGFLLWLGTLASGYALWSCSDRPLSEVITSRIDSAEAKQELDRGDALFVDLRSTSAYEAGHIPGALHLPYDAPVEHLRQVLASDARIIAYCERAACETSNLITRLSSASTDEFKLKIYILKGGWPIWKKSGYPTATDTKAGS